MGFLKLVGLNEAITQSLQMKSRGCGEDAGNNDLMVCHSFARELELLKNAFDNVVCYDSFLELSLER